MTKSQLVGHYLHYGKYIFYYNVEFQISFKSIIFYFFFIMHPSTTPDIQAKI